MEVLPAIILIVAFVIVVLCIMLNPQTWESARVPRYIRAQDQYRVWMSNRVEGPMSGIELLAMKAQGKIHGNTLVADSQGGDWLAFDQYQQVNQPLPPPAANTLTSMKNESAQGSVQPGQFDLTKAGGILLGIGLLLSLFLGVGLVESILLAAGIILLVVGLSRKS